MAPEGPNRLPDLSRTKPGSRFRNLGNGQVYLQTPSKGGRVGLPSGEEIGMKSLRLLAFGVAIGVLAFLWNAPPASAGNAVERTSAPRLPRPQSTTRVLSVGRPSQPNPMPARRPAPHHPSRSPARTASHRSQSRSRSDGFAATLIRTQDDPTPLFAWRIGAFRSIAHSSLDGLVNSGRGPPRAGPQLSASRACSPIRRCVSRPASDSQVVLLLPAPSRHLQATSQVGSMSQRGLMVPPRAVRHEGTAACLSSPSLGEFS